MYFLSFEAPIHQGHITKVVCSCPDLQEIGIEGAVGEVDVGFVHRSYPELPELTFLSLWRSLMMSPNPCDY